MTSVMRAVHALDQYAAAEELERYLGDPSDPDNAFSFKLAVEQDERDEYPEAACRMLDEWGFNDYYVPAEHGGKLASFEELISLVRVIARRDLTVAVAHVKTYLGAVAVWVIGSEAQKERMARVIKNREQVALALTERAHGSDILASDVRAEKTPRGHLLTGEKWLINNATRSTTLTVFARTASDGGPRGFSFFMVEKGKLDESTYEHLPRVKTHGLHGADISGIRFDAAEVAPDSMIGPLGSGLETAVKKLQITRSIVPALSLGAADTALRVTLDFALRRRLYGEAVFAIPHARRTIVDAFLDLIVCESLTTATARAIQVVPRQMSVLSAAVKYFVPTTVEAVIRNLSVVLGARHYLREGHWSGIFQKIIRDNAIAGLFDGSTLVNLNAISLQLRHLSEYHARTGREAAGEASANVEKIFNLAAALPAFDPARLELQNRGRDDVLQGLELSLARVRALKPGPDLDGKVLEEIVALVADAVDRVDRLYASVGSMTAGQSIALDKSAHAFDQAKAYCALHAAAACVHLWVHNRDDLGEFFAKGEWLLLCLGRLFSSSDLSRSLARSPYVASVAREVERLHRQNRSFSLAPLKLSQKSHEIGEVV